VKRFHFKNFVGATKQGVRAELLEGLAQVPVVGLTSSVVGQHVRQLFSNYLFFPQKWGLLRYRLIGTAPRSLF